MKAAPITRPALVLAALAAVGGCSQESGHTPAVCRPTIAVPAGVPFAPETSCTGAPAVPAGTPLTLSGAVTYDLVPVAYDPATGRGGLDFASASPRPVRGAYVQIRQCDTVLRNTSTDETGRYAATFTPGATGRIYVTVLAETAEPPIKVQDNTDGDAVWAVAKPLDAPASTLDLHAPHGFDGCRYGAWRTAAPFAILDSIYTASRRLLDLPRSVPFASYPLRVNWSPSNVPSYWYAPASGQIQTSHYVPSSYGLNAGEVFILGADGVDTDEFDRSVIVHEWAHYFEDRLSRSESPGGYHTEGSVLDPRLSFGEGYASAFGAMLLDQAAYADTAWLGSGIGIQVGWDSETAAPAGQLRDLYPGPFSELSVVRALWDLYDPANEAWDTAALGLGPLYDTLVGPQRITPALTTIASFIAGLKAQPAVGSAAVDGVLAHYAIGPITSPWGDGDAALRAMYREIAVPSEETVTLDGRFYENEAPQNQYFVLVGTGAQVSVSVVAPEDVDLEAWDSGTLLDSATSAATTETISFGTVAGKTYVVVLTGYGYDPAYTASVAFASP